MINLDYKDKRPLHQQIEDGIKGLVINGIMLSDEQLPSVRELSVSLTVNPNTVQKAYKQLESDGFIYSVPGKGSYISPVSTLKDDKKIDEIYEELAHSVKSLMFMGEGKDGILNLVNNIYLEKEEEL